MTIVITQPRQFSIRRHLNSDRAKDWIFFYQIWTLEKWRSRQDKRFIHFHNNWRNNFKCYSRDVQGSTTFNQVVRFHIFHFIRYIDMLFISIVLYWSLFKDGQSWIFLVSCWIFWKPANFLPLKGFTYI